MMFLTYLHCIKNTSGRGK